MAIVAAMSVTDASACPELDRLAERHGITSGGFIATIPAVEQPALSNGGRSLQLSGNRVTLVSDGFRYEILFESATRKVWILRTGGFTNERQWYGPVDAGDARLEDCPAAARTIKLPFQQS